MKRSTCRVAHRRHGCSRTAWNRRSVVGLCPAAVGGWGAKLALQNARWTVGGCSAVTGLANSWVGTAGSIPWLHQRVCSDGDGGASCHSNSSHPSPTRQQLLLPPSCGHEGADQHQRLHAVRHQCGAGTRKRRAACRAGKGQGGEERGPQ